jgi:glycosyltransferase involved in cell wall biosynthesis
MDSAADSGPCVLQVLPALQSGGVERGTIEITEAISRAGGRAIVASEGGKLEAMVRRAGGSHVTLPLASKNPAVIWANSRRLAGLIAREGVDIVHARSRAPAWSAWLACRGGGAHFITTWHGSYSENLPLKRRYNDVMARGERVIAISQHIAAQISARHHVPAARLRVIPRGVDPAVFDPARVGGDRLIRLTRSWRLPDDQAVVLLAGRLTRWKGQTVAIEALALMQRRDVCLILAGDDQGRTAYVREVMRLAVERGVGDRVRLVGDCADMPAALLLADIALNVSTEPEGFGRTVIEAQAMARPLIATDHGGAAETVADEATGFLIPPANPQALAAALDHVLSLPPARREVIGAAARASVCADYTVAAMQRATLDVYNEVLADG